MSIDSELRDLKRKQANLQEGTRLFHDGTIKIHHITESGKIGWYVLAGPVPGAGIAFRNYFNKVPEGNFLVAEGMREAITIRDRMIEQMVEARVHRQQGNDLRNQPGSI